MSLLVQIPRFEFKWCICVEPRLYVYATNRNGIFLRVIENGITLGFETIHIPYNTQ